MLPASTIETKSWSWLSRIGAHLWLPRFIPVVLSRRNPCASLSINQRQEGTNDSIRDIECSCGGDCSRGPLGTVEHARRADLSVEACALNCPICSGWSRGQRHANRRGGAV